MNRMAALLVLLGCSPVVGADDWPQWLGPRRDGGTRESVAVWTEAPKVAWRAPVGPGFSSPVVAEGRVFVHARVPGQDKEEVIALDLETGKPAWRQAYDRPPYSSALNTGPQATPTVAGGRVYAYGITGTLSCFQADTGKLLWRVDPFQKLNVRLPRFGVTCSPLVVGNRVLVAVGGKGTSIVAFDTETGDMAWQGFDEPAGTSSPVLFASSGPLPDAVFMTTLRLIGINPLDGGVSWEFPLAFQPSGTAPTPIVQEDLIVTSTMTNGSTAVRIAAAGSKPAKAWQEKDLHGYFSSGVCAGDYFYLVKNQLKPIPRADLCCVDRKTGKPLWTKEGMGYFHFGMVRTGNDKLLILDDRGIVKLLDARAGTYRELCQAKACGGNLVTPALAGGRLLARDDKEVVCLRLLP